MENLQRNKTTAEQAIRLEDGNINPLNQMPYSPRHKQLLAARRSLPVAKYRGLFLDGYQKNQIVILTSDTGSGKTTQIPQYILFDEWDAGLKIASTQPRRLGTREVASRVADEMDVVLGEEVGYAIKNDKKAGVSTRLLYTTDGYLLQEAKRDPAFSQYSCIIIDEAHERTVNTDILMALLLIATSKRQELKVVLMSATMDAAKFRIYFNSAPRLHIPGKPHDIVIQYLAQATPDYQAAAIRTIKLIHEDKGPGDILLFLSTAAEIEQVCVRIRQNCEGLTVKPLYGALSRIEQHRAITRDNAGRRCIVTTNIAETSLTIEGIVFVIDSGFVMQMVYNPRTRTESLQKAPISQAAARQRAGRAGRTQNGSVFRLYTKEFHDNYMPVSTQPQILTSEGKAIVLAVKSAGHEDVMAFNWIDPPAPETLLRAMGDLNDLGFLDNQLRLTDRGRIAALLPLDPIWFYTIMEAKDNPQLGCGLEICAIAALCSTQKSIFLRPHGYEYAADEVRTQFEHPLSDHLTLLNAFHAFLSMEKQGVIQPKQWCKDNFLNYDALEEAVTMRDQIFSMIGQKHSSGGLWKKNAFKELGYDTDIRQCLARGLFLQTAIHYQEDVYRTVHDNRGALLQPDSVLVSAKHEWVVWTKFVISGKQYLQTVTAIKPEWIEDLAYFKRDRMGKHSLTDPNSDRALKQPKVLQSLEAARTRKSAPQ